jgi:hypothetical protein
MRLHPVHVTVALFGNPLMQTRGRMFDSGRRCHADRVKALFARTRKQRALDVLRVLQKSRFV